MSYETVFNDVLEHERNNVFIVSALHFSTASSRIQRHRGDTVFASMHTHTMFYFLFSLRLCTIREEKLSQVVKREVRGIVRGGGGGL